MFTRKAFRLETLYRRPGDNLSRLVSTALYWVAACISVGWAFEYSGLKPPPALLLVVLCVLTAAAIFERVSYKRRLRSGDALSHIDELTGLPNRRLFQEELRSNLARPPIGDEILVIFFMDLDRFKTINDTFGHSVGDQFLRAVGSRLQAATPPGSLLARFGGDEFTLLLNTAQTRDEVMLLAQEIMELFEEPVKVRNQELWANASLGIVFADAPGMKADDLLSKADTALYHAKAQGRGRFVVYEPDMPPPSAELPSLAGDLRMALSNKEFVIHYQPLVDLSAMKIRGFEALVRWNHPRMGMIPPGVFIPLAEESGIIRSLGSWMIASACEQVAAWNHIYGEDLSLSLNLSALEFRQRNLVSHLATTVNSFGMKPEAIEIEITESILMEDDKRTEANLTEMRKQGFRIAIDDFGVGYSSLSYLKRFEVDTLKIDRSFLSDLDNPRSAALVRGTIALGHDLKMQIVAEGIETPEQLQFMIDAGCDLGQGYLLGKPKDEKVLSEILSFDGLQITIPDTEQRVDIAQPERRAA